jgi:small subunit ribosomal protein S2
VPVVTMKQMLEAGVHFGHQTRRWNPKMKRFIFGERNGIYIVDLNQTLELIDVAYRFVRDEVADGKTILFVGTKKQAQEPVKLNADRCGMPYVNYRWLGGMLTNYQTVHQRVAKLRELERLVTSGETEQMIKKEGLKVKREVAKLQRNLGGIRGIDRRPDMIFVIDTKKEHIAVTEARRLGIPVVAIVDTNCDPDVIDFVIPGNDDAIRSANLMSRVISEAVLAGKFVANKRDARPGTKKTDVAEKAPVDPEVAKQKAADQQAAANEAAMSQREREARLAAAAAEPKAAAPEAASETTTETAAGEGAVAVATEAPETAN